MSRAAASNVQPSSNLIVVELAVISPAKTHVYRLKLELGPVAKLPIAALADGNK